MYLLFYEHNRINLITGRRVMKIMPKEQELRLDDGSLLKWDHLLLATGARPRPLAIPGHELDGVCYLRTLEDVDLIRPKLEQASEVMIIGAGFIGLEFAAVARKLGKKVRVLEAAGRVMERVAGPVLSGFFEQLHQRHGVEIICQAMAMEIIGENGAVKAVAARDGRRWPADLVIAGIGVLANQELAEGAGLECANGIVADRNSRTSHPHIYAAGDCALYAHPFIGRPTRLESVQNASDQARAAASAILGQNQPYESIPWFWSDQYDIKLQIAGLALDCDQHVLRGSPENGRFAIFHFAGRQLRAVEAVNMPAIYMAGRKMLEAGISPTLEQAADPSFRLKTLLAGN